jgi:hypothetical protein
MAANDAIVERALEAIRALNRKQITGGPSQAAWPAEPAPEPAHGLCFHCGGTGRCNCVACDPPSESLQCRGWLQ